VSCNEAAEGRVVEDGFIIDEIDYRLDFSFLMAMPFNESRILLAHISRSY
jgi:hypothetical protein